MRAGKARRPELSEERSLLARLTQVTAELAGLALRVATRTGTAPLRVAQALWLRPEQLRLLSPEQLELLRETGLYLRELRELAGLTIQEVADAIQLRDRSLLEAVENGTATLSFELVLRLAALLARHDPVPFILRATRTYNPELWKILDAWGIGRLPLQYERERLFLNILRGHDAARKLSDEEFERVLDFTRAAFELSMRFVDSKAARKKTRGRRADSRKT
ncbi:MAG: hypothetical protein KatS3mg076_2718 [Candidatus Binatia bacterium]|nr:MAG: hypothetical protein KatS3mg076_2718 [Candidatus Binatia bacterium]